MSNYSIIRNEQILSSFIEWLPELRSGECYYVVLLARNKYIRDLPDAMHLTHIRSDKQQLARFTCDKKSLRNRIKQLECEVGAYRTRRDNESIPQEALALYITVNPRSHIQATKEAIKMMADYLTSEYNGYHLDQDVLSCIQRNCGNRVFFDLDFDGVDYQSTINQINQYINPDCLTALKTRGGFHVLVKLSAIANEFKKNWYKNITSLPGVDVRGDNLVPVAGCTQGNFVPYFL